MTDQHTTAPDSTSSAVPKKHWIKTHILKALCIVVILVIGIVLCWWFGVELTWDYWGKKADHIPRSEIVRNIFLAIAGFAGLILARRRTNAATRQADAALRNTEAALKNSEAAVKQAALATKAQNLDRIRSIAEDLESGSEIRVLGALEQAGDIALAGDKKYFDLMHSYVSSYFMKNASAKIAEVTREDLHEGKYNDLPTEIAKSIEVITILNNYRQSNDHQVESYNNKYIKNIEATSTSIAHSNFYETIFKDVTFENSKFYTCVFEGSDFNNCNFNRTRFDYCSLREIQLRKTNTFESSNFDNCDLSNSLLRTEAISRCNFIRCNFSNTRFEYTGDPSRDPSRKFRRENFLTSWYWKDQKPRTNRPNSYPTRWMSVYDPGTNGENRAQHEARHGMIDARVPDRQWLISEPQA